MPERHHGAGAYPGLDSGYPERGRGADSGWRGAFPQGISHAPPERMDDIMMRGMNMQQMMKQAKAMQKKMMAEHEELAKQEFVGKAPDDMVTATFSGDNQLIDLKIKPEAVDPDDIDMLQDLVIAAVKDGMKQVNDATQQKLGKYTQGMGL